MESPSGKLDAKRLELCSVYHRGLTAPFAKWCWGSLDGGCQRAVEALGRYAAAIRQHELLSYDLEFSHHEFRQLLDGASHMEKFTVSECTQPPGYDGIHRCPCEADDTRFLNWSLMVATEEIRGSKPWFGCLACLNTVELSKPCEACSSRLF